MVAIKDSRPSRIPPLNNKYPSTLMYFSQKLNKQSTDEHVFREDPFLSPSR